MPSQKNVITFVVSGTEGASATRGAAVRPVPGIGTVKQSVEVHARRSSQGGDVRVEALAGEDAVVLHIAGGPALWLHPENLIDLLNAQRDPAQDRGEAPEALNDGEIRIPARLQWGHEQAVPTRGVARGFLGDVIVKAVEVITGFGKESAAEFAASLVVTKVDGRVTEGVYQLNATSLARLAGLPMSGVVAAGGPSLVLVHGTFSDTSGTFGKLWTEHPARVRALFDEYENRVFALDHRTLGVSPIANAITLAKAVAPRTRLHLLTHSRGGLVAEVLARVAANPADSFAPFDAKGYATQRAELRTLAKILKEKKITIERIVRVACPARGTLLASKRLDAYVSVVKWALELAGAPVVPELLEFLGEVARRRADPESLPGLAAQIPDSPLVQWLHGAEDRIAGDLRVIAGDVQGDSVWTWVKTLLADAFFWTDSDFVVQTRSMYGGTPREDGASFVLDRGGQVSHFSYFSNPASVKAITDGLLVKDKPPGFQVIGPLSWGGSSSTGVRAALPSRTAASASALPAVFLLPGILGSHLRVGKNRIWIGWRLVNGFKKLTYDASGVAADGPIGWFYDDLAAFLSEDHHVIPFGFDWRRPIEDAARLLADAVDAELDARKASGQPVRLIAHSMGGIVARTMQLVRPKTWARMMKADGARFLMLGTPNGGSFAPMQVLSGDDTFGNIITGVGAPFRGKETRELIAQFTGLLQLQAGLLDDLGTVSQWKTLAEGDLKAVRENQSWHRELLQLRELEWGIPTKPALDAAVSLRRKLDEQRDKNSGAWGSKALLVIGQSPATPVGYDMVKGGLVYLDSARGDGRVSHESAVLPGVPTWTVPCEHGDLAAHRQAFEAYRDLLKDGKTPRLKEVSGTRAARGAGGVDDEATVPSRPARGVSAAVPAQLESEILASAGGAPKFRATPEAALQVTVVNGDLTFIAEPLLIGHYQSSRLTGAEAVMNRAINGAMNVSLQRGVYPVAAGTHQIFINTHQSRDNPWQVPRPHAVIVAGLGAEGSLRGTDLVTTVRQAVIAWGLRLAELGDAPSEFTLATTLLGTGGAGCDPGTAAQLIVQGVREANLKLAGDYADSRACPRVGHLKIIELYLDRAGEAWRSLQPIAGTTPDVCALTPAIDAGLGALRRPAETGYRGADYDFISAVTQLEENAEESIVYSIDTKRARSEVRAVSPQLPMIRSLVESASRTDNDNQIGRTLFSLLVPVDLKAFMNSSGATILEVDSGTASIPWELLDAHAAGSAADRPWAIRTKLLRKLRTKVTGERVNDATADDGVLVIGDPACDRNKYLPLLGARREAKAVAGCFGSQRTGRDRSERRSPGPVVTALIAGESHPDGPDMNAVMGAAMAGPWRIIHIAGHGEPPQPGAKPLTRGVVLSGKSFLGPKEIKALDVAPELVFVNCCHLAESGQDPLAIDRPAFASGVAEALIAKGVRCVVAAGWAVDDGAAETFAKTFYARLMQGATFIDAVAAAREAARACGGNTWAAYQCYGDPDWRFRSHTSDAQGSGGTASPAQELSAIASRPALQLALEAIAVKTEYQHAREDEQADRLRFLEQSMPHLWRDSGQVQEAFGNAWGKLGCREEAIAWYERARTAADGSASLAAIEQLANLTVRVAERQVAAAPGDHAVSKTARRAIARAMSLLDLTIAVGATVEREGLYGSAFKRLAMIEAAAGDQPAETQAIVQMRAHYAGAERIARARLAEDPTCGVNLYYPAMNRMAGDIVLAGGKVRAVASDTAELDLIRHSMASASPNFWTVVGQTELDVYASILAGCLATDLPALTERFAEHHRRVDAVKMWESVHDNWTFVLSNYLQRASPAEVRAAGKLLATLAGLAKRPAPSGRRKARPSPKKRVSRKHVSKS